MGDTPSDYGRIGSITLPCLNDIQTLNMIDDSPEEPAAPTTFLLEEDDDVFLNAED